MLSQGERVRVVKEAVISGHLGWSPVVQRILRGNVNAWSFNLCLVAAASRDSARSPLVRLETPRAIALMPHIPY